MKMIPTTINTIGTQLRAASASAFCPVDGVELPVVLLVPADMMLPFLEPETGAARVKRPLIGIIAR